MNANSTLADRMEPHGALTGLVEAIMRAKLTHYASELNIDSEALSEAIGRTTEICTEQGIAVQENVMRVFIGAHDTVQCDWFLSDLGYEMVRQRALLANGHH